MARMAGLSLCAPSPGIWGSEKASVEALRHPIGFSALGRWVRHTLSEGLPVIVATDTLAYGGLIPSRLGSEPLETLQARVAEFLEKAVSKEIFAFSSILRIPDYANAEEEPDYWATYGPRLHAASVAMHAQGHIPSALAAQIPAVVWDDFIQRRQRNAALNHWLLEQLRASRLHYLALCQDDTGPQGLNVLEAAQLRQAIQENRLHQKAHVQTGADELACTLLARWWTRQIYGRVPRWGVWVQYSQPEAQQLVARFDGLPIAQVVAQQVATAGGFLVDDPAEADLWLMVHTPQNRQGDHMARLGPDTLPQQYQRTLAVLEEARHLGKPFILADVACANGADDALMQQLLRALPTRRHWETLYGWAAWNTPGNSIGCAMAMGALRWLAEQQGTFNAEAWAELLLTRLADDWCYQAMTRGRLRDRLYDDGAPSVCDAAGLSATMADTLALLQKRLGLDQRTAVCQLPYGRLFEMKLTLS
jgi:hypothetical protein